METFKLIIAGSRRFCNYKAVAENVNKLLTNKRQTHLIEVISGEAQGPDTLGRAYAIENGFRVCLMPAKWEEEGRSAGMKRNERMAEFADAAVIFYDGSSPGTTHMIKTMIRMRKQVRVFLVDTIKQELTRQMTVEEIYAVG